VSNLNRRIRNMEDEMEQLTTKLRTTNDKLEDIAKAADECERLTKIDLPKYLMLSDSIIVNPDLRLHCLNLNWT